MYAIHQWRAWAIAAALIGLLVGLASFTVGARAHEADEFDFTAVATEACLDPGDTWSILWTIENFDGSNPFGIVDTDITDGADPTFSPLVDDPAPGMYIPEGDSATATTTHSASVASVALTVTHDVTEGDDTEWTEEAARPPLCASDDASITVRKVVENVSNDTTGFNVDFSAGVPDITGLDENDAPVTRGGLTPGLYILTEYAVPTGYEFVSWTCESDQLGADVDADNTAMDVAIGLRAGEDIFCTLTNRPRPATATPTATNTPAATATPSATQTPIVITNTIIERVLPAPTQLPSNGTIRPPSTGDGGLAAN